MITVYYFSTFPYNDFDKSTNQVYQSPLEVERIKRSNMKAIASDDLALCPAFGNYFNNTFSVKCLYDYDFEIKDKGIHSQMYDQDFYDRAFALRDMDHNFMSLKTNVLHMILDKPVEVSQIQPTMGKGDLAKFANVVPGTFNPYYHPRAFDSAYWFNKNKISLKEGDDAYYIKFHTNEKVEFKKINYDNELLHIFHDITKRRDMTKRVIPLPEWYKNGIKLKRNKRLLDIIKKKNLIIQ
jgi:hypothetical protein